MTVELFKIIAPIVALAYILFVNSFNKVNIQLSLAILFFSIFFFSANYQIFYRELNILIKILLSLYVLITIISNKGIMKYDKNIKLMLAFLLIILTGSFKISHVTLYIDSLVNYISTITIMMFIFLKLKKIVTAELLFLFISNMSFIIGLLMALFSLVSNENRYDGVSITNYMAYMLGVGFVFMLFTNRANQVKFFQGLVIVYAIYLTQSRSVLLIIPIVLFLKYYSKNRINIKLLIFIPILMVILYILLGLESSRFNNISEDASLLQRLQLWIISYNIFIENYIVGVGYGQFQFEFKNYFTYEMHDLKLTLVTLERLVTHNDYLRVITELGIFGGAVFIYMHFVQWSSILTIKNIYNRNYGFMLMSLFILNLSFSMSHNNLNSVLFWFTFTLPILIERLYLLKNIGAIRTKI
ncbi:Membrane protein [uncultured Candidatus Thioglobus sp.]|nr:Membrane protein [uncultured Candidatus Thioglobus sp.]